MLVGDHVTFAVKYEARTQGTHVRADGNHAWNDTFVQCDEGILACRVNGNRVEGRVHLDLHYRCRLGPNRGESLIASQNGDHQNR